MRCFCRLWLWFMIFSSHEIHLDIYFYQSFYISLQNQSFQFPGSSDSPLEKMIHYRLPYFLSIKSWFDFTNYESFWVDSFDENQIRIFFCSITCCLVTTELLFTAENTQHLPHKFTWWFFLFRLYYYVNMQSSLIQHTWLASVFATLL